MSWKQNDRSKTGQSEIILDDLQTSCHLVRVKRTRMEGLPPRFLSTNKCRQTCTTARKSALGNTPFPGCSYFPWYMTATRLIHDQIRTHLSTPRGNAHLAGHTCSHAERANELPNLVVLGAMFKVRRCNPHSPGPVRFIKCWPMYSVPNILSVFSPRQSGSYISPAYHPASSPPKQASFLSWACRPAADLSS